VADAQRRVSEIAEAVTFFLAVLAYLWFLAIPLPWAGVLVLLAVVLSWRRRSLTPKSLGLGWAEFRASGRRWWMLWTFSFSVFLILEYRSLFTLAALAHGVAYLAWAAAQQIVYQSMTYLPLRDNLKSRGLAAGIAAIAFSVMHVPNPVLAPATYVWGFASSLLFERCRSIWGLALMQLMLSSALFSITPPELSRNFRIGPYYYKVHSTRRSVPAGAAHRDHQARLDRRSAHRQGQGLLPGPNRRDDDIDLHKARAYDPRICDCGSGSANPGNYLIRERGWAGKSLARGDGWTARAEAGAEQFDGLSWEGRPAGQGCPVKTGGAEVIDAAIRSCNHGGGVFSAARFKHKESRRGSTHLRRGRATGSFGIGDHDVHRTGFGHIGNLEVDLSRTNEADGGELAIHADGDSIE
jgi:hypothetical protein